MSITLDRDLDLVNPPGYKHLSNWNSVYHFDTINYSTSVNSGACFIAGSQLGIWIIICNIFENIIHLSNAYSPGEHDLAALFQKKKSSKSIRLIVLSLF